MERSHRKVNWEPWNREEMLYSRLYKQLGISEGSQMPRHLISDAHEWINEIPTVPIYYLAKPQPRERAWKKQRGKKTLLSLTLIFSVMLTEKVGYRESW